MKIKVQVVSRSSRNAIEKLREGSYKVWVTAMPVKGKANIATIKLLAWEFDVSKVQVQLVSGHTSKSKIFQIDK